MCLAMEFLLLGKTNLMLIMLNVFQQDELTYGSPEVSNK